MAKYRTLTAEELAEMEKEFIDFLVLNGITGEDWVKLKKDDAKSADAIISAFSDVVFERILRLAKFIEFRDEKDIYCIQCLDEKMILIGIKSSGIIDLRTDPLAKVVDQGAKIYTTEKPYGKPREEEIFELLQKGYQLSDGTLFKQLCLVL